MFKSILYDFSDDMDEFGQKALEDMQDSANTSYNFFDDSIIGNMITDTTSDTLDIILNVVRVVFQVAFDIGCLAIIGLMYYYAIRRMFFYNEKPKGNFMFLYLFLIIFRTVSMLLKGA